MSEIQMTQEHLEKILRLPLLEEAISSFHDDLKAFRKETNDGMRLITEKKYPCESAEDCPPITILKEGQLKIMTWKTGLIIAGSSFCGGAISTLAFEALKKRLGF